MIAYSAVMSTLLQPSAFHKIHLNNLENLCAHVCMKLQTVGRKQVLMRLATEQELDSLTMILSVGFVHFIYIYIKCAGPSGRAV